MTAEDWELRREARRCLYSASQAQTVREQEMLQGYARFYETLAATECDAGRGVDQAGDGRQPPEKDGHAGNAPGKDGIAHSFSSQRTLRGKFV